MATFGPQFGDDDQGTLSIERLEPWLVEVYFIPSEPRLRSAGRQGDLRARVRLLRFDAEKHTTTLFPVNTMPASPSFLKPKHDPIISIELIDVDDFAHIVDPSEEVDHYVLPKTVDDVQLYLEECLPAGFTKDPNFGLGLDRSLSFIVQTLARIEGVRHLRLTHTRSLDVALVEDGTVYEMGYRLFHELRRGAARFEDRARSVSRKQKRQSAYSNLLSRLDQEKFPVRVFDRDPDDIAETIGDARFGAKLSERDRSSVIAMAQTVVRNAPASQREAVLKLHDEIELASLDNLIADMEIRLSGTSKEIHWQKLFQANPFILDLAFNAPVLLLQGQAHVGGKRIAGAGEKIADFLFGNAMTGNLAIIEIKTPGMPLLAQREYRDGIYAPSNDLVSSITQVLDQANHLQSDIFRLKSRNPEHRMESFGIRSVVVAGTMPDAARQRSFELYRNALAGVAVITYDELLTKLKSLRNLLVGTPTN